MDSNEGKLTKEQLFFIITVAFIIASCNILKVVLGAASTPAGFTYLGVGHYYQDFFGLLQYFSQGIRGRWSLNNPFTPNDPSETVIGWGTYLMMGKIAKIFGFSPVFTYWFFIFLFGFGFCLAVFWFIRQILKNYSFWDQVLAFMATILISPFIKIGFQNGVSQIGFFNYWYAPISLFFRLGGVPHHILANILAITALIFLSQIWGNNTSERKLPLLKTGAVVLVMAFLLTFAPLHVVVILSVLFSFIVIQFLFDRNSLTPKRIILPIFLVIFIIPFAFYIRSSFDLTPLFERVRAWETTHQYFPPPILLLETLGPMLLFLPFGLAAYFKKAGVLKLMLFAYFGFSYLYFYSPLAQFLGTFNVRFITSVVYVFFGVVSYLGLRRFPKIIMILYFAYSLFVHGLIFNSLYLDRLSYMPNEVIRAFEFLDREPKDKAVMTSPDASLGVILPTFADKKVYLGRLFFTPDFDEKNAVSAKFYQGNMTYEEAVSLLVENNVGYVLLTCLDNYSPDNLKKYPLKEIFRNEKALIYRVDIK